MPDTDPITIKGIEFSAKRQDLDRKCAYKLCYYFHPDADKYCSYKCACDANDCSALIAEAEGF